MHLRQRYMRQSSGLVFGASLIALSQRFGCSSAGRAGLEACGYSRRTGLSDCPMPQRRSGARVPERAWGLGVSWTRAAASRGERGPTLGNQARAAPLWTCPGRDDGWDHGSDVSLRPTLAHLSSAPAVLPVVLPKRPSFGQCTPLTASRVCSKHASEALLPAVTT